MLRILCLCFILGVVDSSDTAPDMRSVAYLHPSNPLTQGEPA